MARATRLRPRNTKEGDVQEPQAPQKLIDRPDEHPLNQTLGPVMDHRCWVRLFWTGFISESCSYCCNSPNHPAAIHFVRRDRRAGLSWSRFLCHHPRGADSAVGFNAACSLGPITTVIPGSSNLDQGQGLTTTTVTIRVRTYVRACVLAYVCVCVRSYSVHSNLIPNLSSQPRWHTLACRPPRLHGHRLQIISVPKLSPPRSGFPHLIVGHRY